MKKVWLVLVFCFVLMFSNVYASVVATKTGAVAGEWTEDIDAARALAKANGVPMYVAWGNKRGCAPCDQTDFSIYNQPALKEWAKQNGIPLVDADYGTCKARGGSVGINCSSTAAEFILKKFTYSSLQIGIAFPSGFIFGEENDKSSIYSRDGESLIDYFGPHSGSIVHSVNYFNNGGSVLGFIKKFDSILEYRDNSLNQSTELRFSNTTNLEKLYNNYGQNTLGISLYYTGGYQMFKYEDILDWYNFSNIQTGVNYSIQGINVSDSGNLGKVSFYSGLTNARNGFSFGEMSLNDFGRGYSFSATSNENVYMKVWIEDTVPEASIAKTSYRFHPIDSTGRLGVDPYTSVDNKENSLAIMKKYNISDKDNYYYFGNLSYAIAYQQGTGSLVVSDVPNPSYIDDFQVEAPAGNVATRKIGDFISMFSGWFGSNEKLNITSGQAMNGEWTKNYSSAKELSIQNNRPMVVLFAKSQGEKHSKELIDKVLKSPAWQEYARAKGVSLVFADFFNSSSLTREVIRLYPKTILGSTLKLPTLLYFDSNQNLIGACVYRKGLSCNNITVSSNVSNFAQILESYTGQILDLQL